MKKSASRKSHSVAHHSSSSKEHSRQGGRLHRGDHHEHGEHHDHRFMNAEELRALIGDEVSAAIDAELAAIAYQRHVVRRARHEIATHKTPLSSRFDQGLLPTSLVTADPFADLLPAPSDIPIVVATRALRTPRVNHRTLKGPERTRFNSALQKAHQAGAYQQLSAIHANTAHRMHSSSGAIGTQRFLPWHRKYLLECENLLKTYEPSVRIPYWDYANDQQRPDWVWQPPNVVRGTPGQINNIEARCRPRNGASLPNSQTANIVQNNVTYSDYTSALEVNLHNNVHVWCNGTISCPPTAPEDPIFWLLHANVDRLWNLWQATHNGVPLLGGTDAVLDPWSTTAIDVDSILELGYWYSSVGFAVGPVTDAIFVL